MNLQNPHRLNNTIMRIKELFSIDPYHVSIRAVQRMRIRLRESSPCSGKKTNTHTHTSLDGFAVRKK